MKMAETAELFLLYQMELCEKDIIAQLPTKDTTFSIMVVTKILSDRGTNSLGNFEVQYMHDHSGVKAVQR